MTTEPRVIAHIEYGIDGYVMENVRFTASSLDNLIEQIHAKTRELATKLEEADEQDGDLRQYVPEKANGYASLGLGSAEFGPDEMFHACLTKLTLYGSELTYRTAGYHRVATGAGLY